MQDCSQKMEILKQRSLSNSMINASPQSKPQQSAISHQTVTKDNKENRLKLEKEESGKSQNGLFSQLLQMDKKCKKQESVNSDE